MSLTVLHNYRLSQLHEDAALLRKAASLGFELPASEVCFNIEVSEKLLPDEEKQLKYLLEETFEPEKCQAQSLVGNCGDTDAILEVGPRQQFTSAWSSNAVSICATMGLTKVTRIEKSRRYRVHAASAAAVDVSSAAFRDLALLVHDRMTECVYPAGIQSFDANKEP
jgi:phosphoribosylformylglycinamidine synthase